MLDYDEVLEGLAKDIVKEYAIDSDNNDIYDIIHEFVDLEVSGNHYITNKRIIEEFYDKDIFEVLRDYSDEYGDMDLSIGKVKIYARLAFFAIINYGWFREEIEVRVEKIDDEKSDTTTEE
jgi:hypothetical protein